MCEREAWTSAQGGLWCSQCNRATCWESHKQLCKAGIRETENRSLTLSPRIPTCPALPGAYGHGRGVVSCLPQGALLSREGRCEDDGIQAPRVSLRGVLHLGSWWGSAADLWWLRGSSETQAAWLACHSYRSTSVPGAGQAGQRSLASGSECQHQTQLMFAVCWVDSRYLEVRDSTQEVKAETEPLREGSQRQWQKQHAPGTVLWKGTRWSAQALVQVGRGEECIDSQTHSQEAPDQGGTDTSYKQDTSQRQRGWHPSRQTGPTPGQTSTPAGQATPSLLSRRALSIWRTAALKAYLFRAYVTTRTLGQATCVCLHQQQQGTKISMSQRNLRDETVH